MDSANLVLPYYNVFTGKQSAFLNLNRSLGFVKLRAYAWQIALRPAEGVAGYGEVGWEDR